MSVAHLDPFAADAVRVVVGVGAVVVLPLGLRLLGDRGVPRSSSLLWPLAGLCAALTVWLPVGGAAAALSVPFVAACAVLAWQAVRSPRGPALVVALATPLVGAVALVAERAGWGLLGFGGAYLALTVPHMLYAGFGACLVVGLVGHAAPGSAAARIASLAVPAGVLLVLVGYFVSDAAEFVGAVVLTGGLWAGAVASVRLVGSRAVRVLFRVGAVTIVASMVLALWWALGEATGVVHPSLSWMAATHGVANALGFVLCTFVALRLLGRPVESDVLTYPDVGATRHGPLPSGYRALRVRHLLGAGADAVDLERVGDALLRWRVHAAAHVEVIPSAPEAAEGVRVASRPGVGLLRLSVPCAVVWVERTPRRVGFGYGTLPRHPFRGEEAFTVELDDTGDLWFVVTAFSEPAVTSVRLLGPTVVIGQRLYLRVLARGARRVLGDDRVVRGRAGAQGWLRD